MPSRPEWSFDDATAELYRGLLGREPDPEGQAHYSTLLAQGTPLADVLRSFAGSEEFAGLYRPESHLIRVDYDPRLQVQLALTQAQMARLWRHIAARWNQLGQEDPYWSVLSDPRFRMEHMNDAAVLEAFYDSGRQDVARMDAWLSRNGLGPRTNLVCAEYGCGLGRVSGWFARSCRMLHAFDISASHIGKARAWIRKLGHDNVAFHLVRKPRDLEQLTGIDLFFSIIVLQHNPPPIMHLILDQAFAALNPGGIAYFQLPTYMRGYRFELDRYLGGLDGEPLIEMHCLTQQDVFALASRHAMVPVELEQDDLIGDCGTSHTFLLRKQGG